MFNGHLVRKKKIMETNVEEKGHLKKKFQNLSGAKSNVFKHETRLN